MFTKSELVRQVRGVGYYIITLEPIYFRTKINITIEHMVLELCIGTYSKQESFITVKSLKDFQKSLQSVMFISISVSPTAFLNSFC